MRELVKSLAMGVRLWVLVVTVALLVAGCGGGRDAAETNVSAAVPTVLILDASGSMNQTDAPGPRIDAAKRAAQGLVDDLPDATNTALLAYGSSTDSSDAAKDAGCQDVKVLIPMGALNRQQMTAQISGLSATGYTPISLALRTAITQLPAGDDPQAIILVSDGEDTCGTPPCETAREAQQKYPNIAISTIGFKTEGNASDQLRCIARVTGGLFVQAGNANQLAARLLATQNIEQALSSLSPNGIGGITLGAKLTDIRKAHPNFPDAAMSGSTTVVYRDCDFGFVDGVLESIAPHDGGRTIDGVNAGTPLRRVIELYGRVIKSETNGNGDYRLTFTADPTTGSGYRINIDDYADTGGTISGTVRTIVLCRCAPRPTNRPAPAAPDLVDPAPFADARGDGYYFASPDGRWLCAITKGYRGETAGCNGSQGEDFPVVRAPLVPHHYDQHLTQPNNIFVDVQSAGFGNSGDPGFWRFDGGLPPQQSPVLHSGQSLSVLGYTCNTQGIWVSCRNDATGNGFTFSTDGYKFEYTPVS